MPILLQANHLSKFYGSHEAVHDVSLNIERGSLTAAIGPNGAGKSTTISMLIGIAKPDGGTITFPAYEHAGNASVLPNDEPNADVRVSGQSNTTHQTAGTESDNRTMSSQQARQPTIGVVFQNSVLDPQLTVRENLLCRAKLYKSIADPKERVEELTELVNLTPFASQRYGTLSGGQRRSVDIARALINRPDILVLDEPTTGLDINTRQALWDLLSRLREETRLSILLTTHYLEEAEHAEQVYVIDHGRVMASGSAEQLISRYAEYQLSLTLKPETADEADAMLGRTLKGLAATGSLSLEDNNDRASTAKSANLANLASSPTMGALPTDMLTTHLPTVIAPDKAHRTLTLPNADQSLTVLVALRPYLADFECRPGTMNDVFLALTAKTALSAATKGTAGAADTTDTAGYTGIAGTTDTTDSRCSTSNNGITYSTNRGATSHR